MPRPTRLRRNLPWRPKSNASRPHWPPNPTAVCAAWPRRKNLKKRLIKEKEEFQKYATESLIADLLPVLDHLELALAHGREIEACKDFMVGVDMTRKSFVDILAHHGVAEFGQAGEAFSPETHEAPWA